jgi:hypothetical protein
MPDVLIVSSLISEENVWLLWTNKALQLQGLFYENEFISIADNLAEIEATLWIYRKEGKVLNKF